MQRGRVIRVLGPIEIETPEGVRPIRSRHLRALLGSLVLSAGRCVTSSQLITALWGDAPPLSAERSLQTYVSRLRAVLGPMAIDHTDHAYRLLIAREQVDALRFEDLLARADRVRADPTQCGALCREALGLWRGSPFGDLTDDETFQLESLRLEGLRVAAMELELETELAMGPGDLVTAELESAVEEHPYREHLWHLLIEALRRQGRRVEALRACRRLRNQLAEAGIEADEELTAIEMRIAHEPSTEERRGPADVA